MAATTPSLAKEEGKRRTEEEEEEEEEEFAKKMWASQLFSPLPAATAVVACEWQSTSLC